MNPNMGGGGHVGIYVERQVIDWTKALLGFPADASLNALNQEIRLRLHESGVAAPSYTTLGGRYALRAAITNHRSRREDFDLLIREVVRLGYEVASGR